MKSEIACYHSVQNLCLPAFISKNINIKAYRNKTLPVILYGRVMLFTLREEFRRRVFEYRILRRVFGTKVDDVKS